MKNDVSNMTTHGRLSGYVNTGFEVAKKNFPVVASVSALAFGGITLLLYAWSIGQLPEFTWNDLTGTAFAVCATGVLVVLFVVGYCLSAGYFARSALEAVYPEAAHHVPVIPPDASVPAEPYARLIRGPFILGTTCFSGLAWLGFFVAVSPERLVSPYDEHLLGALAVSLVTAATLVLVDWRRFQTQWVRYALLSVLSGAIVMVIVIITAWSVGPSSLATKRPTGTSNRAAAIDWPSYWVWALDHAICIGVSAAIGVALLLNLGLITSYIARLMKWLFSLVPWKWPEWLVSAARQTSHVVIGEASDRRLIRAKVYVMFWFCAFTSVVLMMAYAMAATGNAHDWNWNFFFIVTLLTILNWVSFAVRQWRERAGLGLVTAALVFLSYPVLARNPAMFPKMVVTLLGLGNERLATIGLSSRQCATLEPYGVNCIPDNERAITLTNVNLLNRLGGSMVLELLIQDKSGGPATTSATSAATGVSTSHPDHSESQQIPQTLTATGQMGSNSLSAKKCDEVLLSQLQSSDAVDAKALRCVVLVVPKDQVLGYTKANWRTYRGEYTAYQPGPAKIPAVVKVISDEPGEVRRKAALSFVR
ncbi:hypothetical protein [Ralstonia pseudosolanacearum]|uniref:Transmembrane protein n=1 Tax=Ralstonia solanacearum TaxID=305 RepID=A0AA92ICT7_RALSL|nr:hypothetical protein [Ralstonia pseudosolanacearum]QCX47884.1 hypothetical protein E7Z57_01450 [Ralstonia pseudosolanacearum]